MKWGLEFLLKDVLWCFKFRFFCKLELIKIDWSNKECVWLVILLNCRYIVEVFEGLEKFSFVGLV